jgi:hypothetical protein
LVVVEGLGPEPLFLRVAVSGNVSPGKRVAGGGVSAVTARSARDSGRPVTVTVSSDVAQSFFLEPSTTGVCGLGT